MADFIFTIKKVLRSRNYFSIFLISAILLFVLLVLIPIFTIPANNLSMQLKIFTPQNYLLMGFFSLLAGVILALSWYSFRQQKEISSASQSVAAGAASTFAGIFGAVVGTASCLSCLVALLSLVGLGVGSALFVLENQSYFLLGAIVLMLISLYFTTQKITRVCESC